ncbi:hypothetical protein CAC42_2282 [Sphaceloma murrayae]|uniref:Uncharacterized protein n=1 Tax=Sphaceloma murrayae TaxID=2082308 RepID=A0A2K1QJL6_9PEZI|nr:hypothetical protein CAC42_2282 [Sphaceloma murrayae]
MHLWNRGIYWTTWGVGHSDLDNTGHRALAVLEALVEVLWLDVFRPGKVQQRLSRAHGNVDAIKTREGIGPDGETSQHGLVGRGAADEEIGVNDGETSDDGEMGTNLANGVEERDVSDLEREEDGSQDEIRLMLIENWRR